MMKYKDRELGIQKNIALIAHDNRKQDLLLWALANKDVLTRHKLHATGTTGGLIEAELGTDVGKFLSGPMGGDQQIGAAIAEGEIDVLIFFWDPFEPLPHDPDVKALLRLAAVWNIPVACNEATADLLVSSPMFNRSLITKVPDYQAYQESRAALTSGQ
jgi:methylglyoxal synthase